MIELNKIHNMDCLEYMKTVPDKYFDLVLTDPPYGINIACKGSVGGGTKKNPSKNFGAKDWDKEIPSKEIFEHNGLTVYSGLIVSGDQFVARKDQVDAIKEHFPDALCSEMEAATVAQVCTVFNKPFIIVRGLSDIFDKGSSSIQFDQYLKEAAKSSARMCYDLAQKLV